MLAHYFYFLRNQVIQCIYFVIKRIYSKGVKIESAQTKRLSFLEMAYSILLPTYSWACVKYKYHFKFLLLSQSIVEVISPITRFYDWLKPGILDLSFVHQWQLTLTILNGTILCISVLSIILNSENRDWSLQLFGTLSMMTIVTFLMKNYLAVYVNLDKV